jgi:hypothetical protein
LNWNDSLRGSSSVKAPQIRVRVVTEVYIYVVLIVVRVVIVAVIVVVLVVITIDVDTITHSGSHAHAHSKAHCQQTREQFPGGEGGHERPLNVRCSDISEFRSKGPLCCLLLMETIDRRWLTSS